MERVECEGGPLDGAAIEAVDGAPAAEITMADGTRHRCARREAGGSRFSRLGRC